jgi:hypothetical protein
LFFFNSARIPGLPPNLTSEPQYLAIDIFTGESILYVGSVMT